VIAKVGAIMTPHWAHQPQSQCAHGAGETQWHAEWKLKATDPQRVEVTRGPHRADCISPTGLTIEFQHSHLDRDHIHARERHWSEGIWVYDATSVIDTQLHLSRHPDRMDDTYRAIRWENPPHFATLVRWPLWLDLGASRDGALLAVGSIARHGASATGYGWLVDADAFADGVINGWGFHPQIPTPQQVWAPRAVTGPPDIDPAELEWRGGGLPCTYCSRTTFYIHPCGRAAHKICAAIAARDRARV
jgi:hypothetical protein